MADVTPGTLHFLCGKMAAGKSTLAKRLAAVHGAVLLEEDHFLATLYPDEIRSVGDYVRCSSRVRDALAAHVVALLRGGVPVVLDFPGNTRRQRRWFRELADRAQAPHRLHFLDVADDVCKTQLRERSRHLPPGAPFTTDAEFEAVTRYFEPPAADEGFDVVPVAARRAGD